MTELELPRPCPGCRGNGRLLTVEWGIHYGRCLLCAGRGYIGPDRDLTTPVLEWAAEVGFVWPAAVSSDVRGCVRLGASRSFADAVAGSLEPSPPRVEQRRADAVA